MVVNLRGRSVPHQSPLFFHLAFTNLRGCLSLLISVHILALVFFGFNSPAGSFYQQLQKLLPAGFLYIRAFARERRPMTYIEEEFVLQNIVLIIPAFMLAMGAIAEIYERFLKPRIPDELTQRKLRRIAGVLYACFKAENPDTARLRTAQTLRDIYKNGLTNEKYDIAKGL